jgi:hypothetical protein
MEKPKDKTIAGDSAPDSPPPESDAPAQPSVRECSDRISVMERELRELRARFANVGQRRSPAASASN